jgi:hypothetical protein
MRQDELSQVKAGWKVNIRKGSTGAYAERISSELTAEGLKFRRKDSMGEQVVLESDHGRRVGE